MLVFEDPRSRRVWLGKALPREWLAAGVDPVAAAAVPTRYGRVGFRLHGRWVRPQAVYEVRANLTLPSSFVGSAGPEGGLRLRLRVPLDCGKLKAVTMGGAAWPAFDPTAETIVFDKAALTPKLLKDVESIVATFEQ